MSRWCWLLLIFPLACFSQQSRSRDADPTRPSGRGAGDIFGAESVEASSGPVLQSVLRPNRGSAIAVIDGEMFHVGDKLGEFKVVRIAESEVVLSGPGGKSVLRLTPDVEKKNRPQSGAGRKAAKGAPEK